MSDLDRNQLLATLGVLSGDPALTNTGKVLAGFDANRQRGKAGRVHIGNGFMLDQATGQVEQDPNYAGFLQDREENRDARMGAQQEAIMRRMGYGAELRREQPHYTTHDTDEGVGVFQTNPNAQGGIGMQGAVPYNQQVRPQDRQKAAEAERLAQEAGNLYGEMQRTQGVLNTPKDITTSALSHIPIVGKGVARAAEVKMYSPEQLRVKTRGARFEQNLSNLAAGLALTGYEIDQRDRWSPFAGGINQDESKRRLENIQRDFNTRRDTIMDAPRVAPGGSYQSSERESGPGQREYTSPPQRSGPRGPAPMQERRTLNGRTYKKVGGKWYTDDGTGG